MLALGGGVTVAADHAQPGDALYSFKTTVNDNVRHEYHTIKASLTGEANADENASLNSDTHLMGDESANDDGAAGGPSHGLMIRTNGDATTSSSSQGGSINADGSVHVNVY